MSLQRSCEQAVRRMGELREVIGTLHLTIAQDKPAADEAVIVSWLDDTVTELLSELEQASGHLAPTVRFDISEGPIGPLREGLRRAHSSLNHSMRLYLTELAAHDSIERLLQMGRERGRAWRDWVGVVVKAVQGCAAPLLAAQTALLECWNEFSEQLARNSVSVRATNIGQQISVREDQIELAAKAT